MHLIVLCNLHFVNRPKSLKTGYWPGSRNQLSLQETVHMLVHVTVHMPLADFHPGSCQCCLSQTHLSHLLPAGIIAELRTQLLVSIQNSAQVAQHSADIEALKAERNSHGEDQIELQRQAVIIDELRGHVNLSAERQREMTRQASILDDLKAQLSLSNDLSVELMFRRTSLEEARALMTQALKGQAHHVEAGGQMTNSFTRMRPSEQKVCSLRLSDW